MHRLLSSQSLSRDGEELRNHAGPSVIRLIKLFMIMELSNYLYVYLHRHGQLVWPVVLLN